MSNQNRPNILFLMADQWHHLDFGYRGHPVVKTPNLDKLASQSIDYTHTYAQNAFCLPSRACMLTGQYVRTHRQYGFTGLFGEGTPCLPELLQQNGYHTFHVGKFHCNPLAGRMGFDEFVPTLPEDMWQATDPDVNYLKWSRDHGIGYPNDQVHGDYRTMAPPEPLELGGKKLDMYGTSCIPLEKSIERYTADQAVAFIERDHEKPFYLSVSFDRPHGPWTPSPEDVDLYDPAAIPLPDPLGEADLARLPEHLAHYISTYSVGLQKIGEEGMRKVLSLYYALITRVDAEIGRLLDTLERTGQADNTIVVFCTDHGDMAGHLGLFDKYSNRLYHDDIIRTPLLLKVPCEAQTPRQMHGNVELIDLFPTLCERAGIPTETLPLDGKDLLSLPNENATPWSGTAFSESYGMKTVIKDGWKLIYYVNHDEGELYDLGNDAREYQNLYTDPACRTKRIELLQELVRFFTPTPSEKRQAYIRTLFDDSDMVARGAMGRLFKWDKGIVEGDGFWQSIKDGHKLTVIPFEGVCRLEKLDADNPADGLVWNYAPVEDDERLEAMLGRLVDYLAGKIRPISLMTGGEEGRENMMFCRGFGLC